MTAATRLELSTLARVSKLADDNTTPQDREEIARMAGTMIFEVAQLSNTPLKVPALINDTLTEIFRTGFACALEDVAAGRITMADLKGEVAPLATLAAAEEKLKVKTATRLDTFPKGLGFDHYRLSEPFKGAEYVMICRGVNENGPKSIAVHTDKYASPSLDVLGEPVNSDAEALPGYTFA